MWLTNDFATVAQASTVLHVSGANRLVISDVDMTNDTLRVPIVRAIPNDPSLVGLDEYTDDVRRHALDQALATYNVTGDQTVFAGAGDDYAVDDTRIDEYLESEIGAYLDILRNFTTSPIEDDACGIAYYNLVVFPSKSFLETHTSKMPEVLRWIVLGFFFVIILIFVAFNFLVERRQARLVDSAAKADAIVKSLFPTTFRDRLYAKTRSSVASEDGATMVTAKRRIRKFVMGDEDEQQSTQNPMGEPMADLFPNTTILFADISGFTAWSSEREPSQVFTLLETLYHAMDQAAKTLKVRQ